MDFKKLFKKNDKAVSPVIGVILMVAITVILAAAIGSSVFNQSNPGQTSSKANVDVKALTEGSGATLKNYIVVEHLGGDKLDFGTTTGTATPAKAKITASVNGGSSSQVLTTDLGVFSPGDVLKIELKNSAGAIAVVSGQTVNVKITNLDTNQVVCDRDVKF
jgi:flagellin-like protein